MRYSEWHNRRCIRNKCQPQKEKTIWYTPWSNVNTYFQTIRTLSWIWETGSSTSHPATVFLNVSDLPATNICFGTTFGERISRIVLWDIVLSFPASRVLRFSSVKYSVLLFIDILMGWSARNPSRFSERWNWLRGITQLKLCRTPSLGTTAMSLFVCVISPP